MIWNVGNLEAAGRLIHRHRGIFLPIIAAGLIFAILVPLPPVLIDILLIGNLTLGAIVLLTTIYVSSPLEFSVFPSLLLGATLIRLVLNVATTRLILTAGADGRMLGEAKFAAGHVVWSFSEFVTLGSLEVGVVIFAIIAIIQFVVITRGAARISEVAARFVLDAMPGKQLAIDADLKANLIDEAQARERRQQIANESDFYGAMDGASKFLRGDAIAAIIITLINILGGMYVGMVRYGWTLSQTTGLFTRLTIGDGLVAQVPAFLVSISAALIVTRSTSKSNLGEEILGQLSARPMALLITALFLVAMTLTSLPKAPLLIIAAACATLGWVISRRKKSQSGDEDSSSQSAESSSGVSGERQIIEPLLKVDPIRIELGYTLVSLLNRGEGDLLDRIAELRKQIALQLGLLVPAVKIKDDMSIDCETYVIKIRGLKVATGQLYARKLLGIPDEEVSPEIPGLEGNDPVTGAPAVWISRSDRGRAEALNYHLSEPASVLVEHLREIIRRYAGQLLSRSQVTKLLDNLKTDAPSLVEETCMKFTTGEIQKVLQGLLCELVPIRDLETILETMCDAPDHARSVLDLTELVRGALGPMLTQQYCGEDGKLWCVSLDRELEDEIVASVVKTDRKGVAVVPPEQTRRIAEAVAKGLTRVTCQNRRPVLLCDSRVRGPLRRLIAPVIPEAAVLAYSEVESVEVQSVGSVGIE